MKSLKNSSDFFRNRTRDLPACSAVPQPTAPPRNHNYFLDSTSLFTTKIHYLIKKHNHETVTPTCFSTPVPWFLKFTWRSTPLEDGTSAETRRNDNLMVVCFTQIVHFIGK
jgi:hypothetical protein